MTSADTRNPVSAVPTFLEPLDSAYFENDQLTSIEVIAKQVTEFPVSPALIGRVTRIRLVNCKMSEFPKGMERFVNLANLEVIENYFTAFPKSFLANFPFLASMDLTSNDIASLDVDLPQSLVTIDVSYNKRFDIATLWRKTLPNLQTLKAAHCGIKELPNSAPSFAGTLRVLQLDGNGFTEIPPVIKDMAALEELSLFGNKLTKFSDVEFPQTFKYVNLYYNEISEWNYAHILKSQTLNLSSNSFADFPVKTLEVESLKVLCLGKCGISGKLDVQLPQGVFVIDLNHNEITEVSPRFVESLKGMSLVNLSHNMLGELPDCFPTDVSVARVYIDGNMLTTVPSSLLVAPRLEILGVSSNKISKLDPFRLPQLKELNIAFNNLDELPDCFDTCPMLAALNVSFNNLENLPKSLGKCRKFMFLTAANNKFLRIPECVLSFSQLKTLVLSGNRLTSIPATCGSLFFLKTLDLSNNSFQSVAPFISRLKALRYLSFSHNAISELPEDFTFPESLVLVDFSYNRLKKFNFMLPKALSLSLEYNELTEFNFETVPSVKFLTLSHNCMTTPLVDQLPLICSHKDLMAFEYIGNEKGNLKEIPPTRIHILADANCQCGSVFGIGYAATLGERPTMEDAVIMAEIQRDQLIYGVFDGHTGNVSSSSAANCLLNEVKLIGGVDNSVFSSKFSDCFTRINTVLKQINVRDGCTAAVAMIRGKTCFTVGVGDSRIVRVKTNGVERVTTDYKPLNRSEFQRLRESGLDVNTEGRINRKLAVARALGDFWIGDGIFVKPDVQQFDIDEDDVAIVVACDGLWDVISDEYAGIIVRNGKTAADAAVSLKNLAFALGSKDNISVIVVQLHPDPDDVGFVRRNTVDLLPVVEEPADEMDFAALPVLGNRRRR